jgi:putative redox protein
MNDLSQTAAMDVKSNERLQSIHVSTEYLGGYQSVNQVRDLPPIYLDEPVELGGKNSGPTALESILVALNSCTAMIMHILRREMKFDLQGVKFEAEGVHDVRRVEMKRTGKLFSQVEPIAYHYHKVIQKIHIRTSEPEERLAKFREEVERLCPVHALLRDAKVNVRTDWIRES